MTTSDTKDEMISRIVAAYAGRPDVGPNEIVSLFNRLRHEMAGGAGAVEMPSSEPQTIAEAAIPLERAMTRDKVYCLCCGKGFKMLKRHIGAEHGLTEAEYRARFGLAADVPLVAPSYSSKKAKYAKETGFGKYARRPARKTAGILNKT
ncbi:MucR family transcriptional regulator [Seohaeicola nanhaiensis]|uniref:MucR family transcriptional regulator n=1 Tax=Seohaeicola nanhaiensis TaxID=1387282 RepID=A0ABV9KI67_9RHOB